LCVSLQHLVYAAKESFWSIDRECLISGLEGYYL
jgi:hypothetical protein